MDPVGAAVYHPRDATWWVVAGAPSRQLTASLPLYTWVTQLDVLLWHTSELEPDAFEAQLSAHNAKHLEIALAIEWLTS